MGAADATALANREGLDEEAADEDEGLLSFSAARILASCCLTFFCVRALRASFAVTAGSTSLPSE